MYAVETYCSSGSVAGPQQFSAHILQSRWFLRSCAVAQNMERGHSVKSYESLQNVRSVIETVKLEFYDDISIVTRF